MGPDSIGDDEMWKILESAPDAMVVCDADGRLLFVNHQAEVVFGYDRASLLGRSVEQLIPDGKRRVHRQYRQEYVRKPDVRPMGKGLRLLAQRSDSSTFPAEIALSPVTLDGQGVVVASVRDVSELEGLKAQREVALAEARAAEVLLAERERMAGELHDTVIQHLFSIGLGLQAVSATVGESAATRLLSAVDQLDEAIRELRLSIFRLKSRVATSPVSVEIRSMVSEAAAHMGAEPKVDITDLVDELVDGELRVDVLNTLREAISNVVRHAQASTLEIRVEITDAELRMVVADDGIGLGGPRPGGNGLRNMGDRAVRHGGKLTVGHMEPSGTIIDWRVPLPS